MQKYRLLMFEYDEVFVIPKIVLLRTDLHLVLQQFIPILTLILANTVHILYIYKQNFSIEFVCT